MAEPSHDVSVTSIATGSTGVPVIELCFEKWERCPNSPGSPWLSLWFKWKLYRKHQWEFALYCFDVFEHKRCTWVMKYTEELAVSTYTYAYVCVYIVYIYMYIYVYIYESGLRIPGPPTNGMVPQAHALGNTGPYIHTYIHACMHPYIHACMHPFIHSPTHTHT